MLEPDHRSAKIVLRDLAIDRDAHLVAELHEDLLERVRIDDRSAELLAQLISCVTFGGTLPIELGAHARTVAVHAHAQHVVFRGHRAVVGVPAAVLEPAAEHERRASALHRGATALHVRHHTLELDLEHRAQSARIARTTAAVSVRSGNTAAAPHARSSSTE